MIETLLDLIAVFLALIVVLPFHEFAHAFVAVKCGDDTPKINGRLTLNPMAHFDPLGLIFFVIAKFGWAKPVPVNPYNFRKYKLHSFFVAIAGVVANFLLAFIAYPLFMLVFLYVPKFGTFTDVLQNSLLYVYSMSLNFFVFNLIPLYPLDGFRVIDSFSRKGKIYQWLIKYSRYILLGLLILGIVADYTGLWFLDILGIIVSYGSTYLGMPIQLFWGLFF